MSTHPKPTGHSIRAISFPRGAVDCSLVCSCCICPKPGCVAHLSAPAPYILEREWGAHRGQTRFRPLPKAPGYVFGGAFK